MNARDELGKLLFTLPVSDRAADTAPEIMVLCDEAAEALLEAGYRKPRTITTADEIKDLPALTMVVHDDIADGGPLEAYVVPDDGTVMFKDRYPFHLLCMNGEYVQAEDMPLPLTVVYEVGA